jgi:hypothetical protein|eukprot:COSAG01_NODE_604_length_14894_cov_24.503211_8_plen_374_part_00
MSLEAGHGALSLTLDPVTLAYTVLVDGQAWFDSGGADGGYAFSSGGTKASLGARGLVNLGKPSRSSGADKSGSFESISITFARSSAGAGAAPAWVSTFKAYAGRPALVFGQRWVQPVADAVGGSTFPSLRHIGPHQLGTLEYTGASCGFMVGGQGEFPGITGGSDKGYIAISPRDNAGLGVRASLALGPVTEHFVNQARNDNSSLIYGMAPTFAAVPAGFELETVLVASIRKSDTVAAAATATVAGPMASIPAGGVNAALTTFGDFLLARHNKTRARGDIKTETEYIGYSTTAYYFYNLCDCLDVPAATPKSAGKPDPHNRKTCEHSPIPARFLAEAATPGVCASYADTLIAVNAALKAQGIPIKHFLLDSWW